MSLSTTLIASGVDWSLLRGITSEHLCEIEQRRPRIAASTEFLHSALNATLSPNTRMRCIFESIYLSSCELSEVQKLSLERVEHPSINIVSAAATVLDLTCSDILELRALTEWAASNSPFMQQLKLEDACTLARVVVVNTIRFFAKLGG